MIGEIELFALAFDDKETPKFTDSKRKMKIEGDEFTIYYSNMCTYVEDCIKVISDYTKNNDIVISINKVDTLEKVRKVSCVFNAWANFY